MADPPVDPRAAQRRRRHILHAWLTASQRADTMPIIMIALGPPDEHGLTVHLVAPESVSDSDILQVLTHALRNVAMGGIQRGKDADGTVDGSSGTPAGQAGRLN